VSARPRIGSRVRWALQQIHRWAGERIAAPEIGDQVLRAADRRDVETALAWLDWHVRHDQRGRPVDVKPRAPGRRRRRRELEQLTLLDAAAAAPDDRVAVMEAGKGSASATATCGPSCSNPTDPGTATHSTEGSE